MLGSPTLHMVSVGSSCSRSPRPCSPAGAGSGCGSGDGSRTRACSPASACTSSSRSRTSPGADLLPPGGGSPPRPSSAARRGWWSPRCPRGRQRVRYSIAPHQRGRYVLGPLTADLSDPFALTKLRVEFDERDELVVAPEVELLGSGPDSPFGMTSGSRSPSTCSEPATSSTRCGPTSRATTCDGSTGRAWPAAAS